MKVGIVSYSSICERKFIPALLKNPLIQSITIATSKSLKNTDKISFTDYENFFEGSYDWIYVSSIPSKNFYYTKKCLSRGWHVLCEKPSFIDSDNYYEIIEIAKNNKLLFMENYSHLFHPRYNILKDKLNAHMDKIEFVDFKFFYPGPSDSSNFRYHKNLGGGVQFDSMGYLLTAANFYFGNINKDIDYNISFTKKNNVVNMISLSCKIEGKIITLSTGIDLQYDASLNFYGKNIKISLEKAFSIDKSEESCILINSGFNTEELIVEPSNQFSNIIDEFISTIKSKDNNIYNEWYNSYDENSSLLTFLYKKINQ